MGTGVPTSDNFWVQSDPWDSGQEEHAGPMLQSWGSGHGSAGWAIPPGRAQRQGWHQLLLGAPQPGQGSWHLPTRQISSGSVQTSSTGDDMLGMRREQAGTWERVMPYLDPLHHPHTLLFRQEQTVQWDKTKWAVHHLASHPSQLSMCLISSQKPRQVPDSLTARSSTDAKRAVPMGSSLLP